MMTGFHWLFVPGLLAAQDTAARLAAPAAGASTATAFVDVAVIPMDRERILRHQTVVVQRHRITALGPVSRVPVPPGARQVDGRGKYLIPGLGDMHAHAEDTSVTALEQWLYANVANGVTTVRIMSTPPLGPHVLAARERADRGTLVSPRLYIAAGPFDSASQVVVAKDSGYNLIKLYGVDGPALDSLAATARRLGIPIVGHVPSFERSPDGLQRALDVGYASIDHLAGFDPFLGSPGFWWKYWMDTTHTADEAYRMLADSTKLNTIAAAFAHARVWNCPTLAMYEVGLWPAGETWPEPELRYLRPRPRHWVQEKAQQERTKAPLPAALAAAEVRRAIVRALHKAGAGLLLGTDTPVPYMVPGFAVHRELKAFVRAGLRPYDALVTGTRNVAAYLGTLDSTGTVAVGKRADLVLLSGNPLDDVGHTQIPAGVMVGGRWLDRTELDRGLGEIEGKLGVMP